MSDTLIILTFDIIHDHLINNSVAVCTVSELITNVYGALSGLGQPAPVVEKAPEPAVSVRASVKPDYIVCLEDGKKLKMLKRHLMTHYQLTPEQYRRRWNLPADYPMVAPIYAGSAAISPRRSALATTPAPARRTATSPPRRQPRLHKRRRASPAIA
jgi:predicted transcriptional regulator